MSGISELQLGPGSGFLLQSLLVQLIEELAVDLDGRGALELETGDEDVSKLLQAKRQDSRGKGRLT
jgi:hypothetical protein